MKYKKALFIDAKVAKKKYKTLLDAENLLSLQIEVVTSETTWQGLERRQPNTKI